jgi:hypothetical protein
MNTCTPAIDYIYVTVLMILYTLGKTCALRPSEAEGDWKARVALWRGPGHNTSFDPTLHHAVHAVVLTHIICRWRHQPHIVLHLPMQDAERLSTLLPAMTTEQPPAQKRSLASKGMCRFASIKSPVGTMLMSCSETRYIPDHKAYIVYGEMERYIGCTPISIYVSRFCPIPMIFHNLVHLLRGVLWSISCCSIISVLELTAGSI